MSEERPAPNLDQVREALREHDERTKEAPAEPPREDDGGTSTGEAEEDEG
jgi:hypothetical protein